MRSLSLTFFFVPFFFSFSSFSFSLFLSFLYQGVDCQRGEEGGREEGSRGGRETQAIGEGMSLVSWWVGE